MLSIQGFLSTTYLIVNPFLSRKLFLRFLKPQLQENLSSPCFILLLIVTWILTVGSQSLFLTDFIIGAPIPTILVGVLGVFVGALLALSSLTVFGMSCATMINMCEKQYSNELTKENLRVVITNFKMLVASAEPFLFVTFSIQVILMIIYLYQATQLFDGCSDLYVVSFIKKSISKKTDFLTNFILF